MLKKERLDKIVDILKVQNIAKVTELEEILKVSDMTIRRDLGILEEEGRITRIHGGAMYISNSPVIELSHADKLVINREEKKQIANYASDIINHRSNEIIFLGPGTSLEILANLIDNKSTTFVTNSLPVFLSLIKTDHKVYLLGGEMRIKTQAFVGEITNASLRGMKFHKTFFSCNGISKNDIMTSTLEEATTQNIAINNSSESYLLADSTKFGKSDFISFAHVSDLTSIITNKDLNKDLTRTYSASKLVLV